MHKSLYLHLFAMHKHSTHDQHIMRSSQTAILDSPSLPLVVRKAHIFPSMQNKALLSLGLFCDNYYMVLLKKSAINIKHNNSDSLSLQGYRDTTNEVWAIDISSQGLRSPSEDICSQANNVYELKCEKDIITYLHKVYCSPVP